MARRNLNKIPQRVLNRISRFEVDDIVVACVKRLRSEDVARYTHLGLAIENGRLVVPPPAVPRPDLGRYSHANVYGREVVRRDLPMVTKTFSIEVPNWGDWAKGSHSVDRTRELYQRDLIAPKEVELSVEVLEQDDAGTSFSVKFAIDQVLNRRISDFEAELLYNLNILQENVGAISVFPSTATLADYTATIRVDWEILPPGSVDDVLRQMLQRNRPITVETERQMKDRLTVLSKLEPEAYIAGTNEFLRYFGAKFADDLVVFENLNYGNALYVMHEQWQILSQRTRIDLLKGPREGFERIEHRDGWEARLNALLRSCRGAKKLSGS